MSARFVPKIVAMLRGARLMVLGGTSRLGKAAFVTAVMDRIGRPTVKDILTV
jgi:hypothetical protein